MTSPDPATLTEGYKADADKPRLELLDPEFLEEVGKVLTFGAKKYNESDAMHAANWRFNRPARAIIKTWDSVTQSPPRRDRRGGLHMDDTKYLPANTKHYTFRELTGQKFGRLTVLRLLGKNPTLRQTDWECACECGTRVAVSTGHLKGGKNISCGCYRRERISKLNTRHGMKGTRVYRIWAGMVGRCTNPNNKDYLRYGAEGIGCCDRWLRSFENFYADMGAPPSSKHTLDRADNSKGYEPGNVRWATPVEQANNRRNNALYTYNGETKNLTQWAKAQGIYRATLTTRLKSGWPIGEALTVPAGAKRSDG